jgi:uncharacterized membrane protein
MEVLNPRSKRRSSTPPGRKKRISSAPPSPAGPKALRIGIIQSGKIVEERILRKRETVAIGKSEKNNFVIGSRDLPSRFEMFETKGGDYTLNFTETMQGRISVADGVEDLAELRKSGRAKKRGKVYQMPLNEQSRGKIVLSDTTVLFQFVTPPPIQPRPQLPAVVRTGFLKNFDLFIFSIWLILFLLHAGVIVYWETTDWPVVSVYDKYLQQEEIAAVYEATLEMEKLQEKKGDEAAEKPDEGEEAKKDQQKKWRKAEDEAPSKSAEEIARERAERRAALAEQIAQRGINKIIGSLGGDGSGVISDVLRGGDVGVDQDELLSQISGVGVASGDNAGALRGPAGGKGSGEAADISQLRMEGGDAVVRTEGPGQEKQIRGEVKRKEPSAIDGTGVLSPQEVAKVVNRRLGAIKGCYERALRRNPNLEGKVTIQFTVAGGGKVTSARATLNELTPEVGECIVSAFMRFRFPEPEGGSTTFEYPFLFTPAQ